VDVERVEHIEADINALIDRRSHQKTEANELAEMWRASERSYRERHRRQIRAAWYGYFADLADTLRQRADEYDEKAIALLEEPQSARRCVVTRARLRAKPPGTKRARKVVAAPATTCQKGPIND